MGLLLRGGPQECRGGKEGAGGEGKGVEGTTCVSPETGRK